MQLNKLKSGIKDGTKVIIKLSPNVVDYSSDQNKFPHKLLLINTQVLKLGKYFPNNSSTNIKLSKTKFHKIEQSGRFLVRISGTLLKTGLPLMKIVLKP